MNNDNVMKLLKAEKRKEFISLVSQQTDIKSFTLNPAYSILIFVFKLCISSQSKIRALKQNTAIDS